MSSTSDQPTPDQIQQELILTKRFTTAVRIASAALDENKIPTNYYGNNVAVATLAVEISKSIS